MADVNEKKDWKMLPQTWQAAIFATVAVYGIVANLNLFKGCFMPWILLVVILLFVGLQLCILNRAAKEQADEDVGFKLRSLKVDKDKVEVARENNLLREERNRIEKIIMLERVVESMSVHRGVNETKLETTLNQYPSLSQKEKEFIWDLLHYKWTKVPNSNPYSS